MPSKKHFRLSPLGLIIWGLAAFFFLYEFFLRTFIGSVAPQVISSLNLNPETFALLGTAYYIAYGAMQIPVGILTDKFGVRIMMFLAALLCAVATYLFTLSTGLTSALITRLLMGLGSSFAFVCLLVIVATWFPQRYFGFFAGLSQFIGTMGPLLGGGPLIDIMTEHQETWQQTLTQIALVGLVLAILIVFIVRNKPRGGEQALIHLQPEQPFIFKLKRLAQNAQAWSIAAYSACVYISMALLGAIWGTVFLQAQGLSQSTAADMVSLAWLGYAIGCPALGGLSDLIKRRKPILIFSAATGLITTSMITYVPLAQYPIAYGIFFFLLGIAGSGQNVGFATIAEQADFQTRATALGLNNSAITLFAALIPPLASYFIFLSAGDSMATLQAKDFLIGFSCMPLLTFIGLMIAIFFIKETFCKPQKEAIILKP